MNQKEIRKELNTFIKDMFTVNEIFSSIQGEGVFVGRPATFVRFNLCSQQCDFCDTKYTWQMIDKNEFMNLTEVLSAVQKKGHHLVVLTGGEPLEQKNLSMLVTYLLRRGHLVQLETNGVFRLPKYLKELSQNDYNFRISLSLKDTIHKTFEGALIHDYKKLVVEKTTTTQLVSEIEDKDILNVSLQPVAVEKNEFETEQNTAKAIKLVTKLDRYFKGRRRVALSLQIHKFLKIS